jgi:polyphosphate kinase
LLCPVESPLLTRELRVLFDTHLADQRSAWDMQPDGSYVQRMSQETSASESSHSQLIAMTERRQKEMLKQKSKKAKNKQ